MYNDNLKATVEANQLAIKALRAQLETVSADVKKTDEEIQKRFKAHIHAYNIQHPFIPTKIKSTLECHINDSSIKLRWADYSKPDRTNSLDIYYYDNNHYDQRDTGNHRWEICYSSNRLIVNTTEAGWAKTDGESLDVAKLTIGIYELINNTSKHIISYHKKYYDNQKRASEIYYAIQKLERDTNDVEKQMAYNTTFRLFKPGGPTSICHFNKDIVFPTIGSYDARSSRRLSGSRRGRYSSGINFNAVRIIKEGKKGLRVEFVRYGEEVEGQERQTWVGGTKWVSLDSLISLYQTVEKSHNERIKIEAEREARRKAEELKNQAK